MLFTLPQTSPTSDIPSNDHAPTLQSLRLSAFFGAVWQPLTAITVVLAVCYTQIMFLRAMIERF
jgi:hypothetical protein